VRLALRSARSWCKAARRPSAEQRAVIDSSILVPRWRRCSLVSDHSKAGDGEPDVFAPAAIDQPDRQITAPEPRSGIFHARWGSLRIRVSTGRRSKRSHDVRILLIHRNCRMQGLRGKTWRFRLRDASAGSDSAMVEEALINPAIDEQRERNAPRR
jgi:hypothetical protein